MALRPILRPAARPAAGSPQAPRPDLIPITHARQAYEPGTEELLIAELGELRREEDKAREATNAVNRQKTKAKNAFKTLKQRTGWKPDDQVLFGDVSYTFDVAYHEECDVSALLDLHRDGKVSKEIMIKCLKVDMGMSKMLLGAHVLDQITSRKAGKEFDIRKHKLDHPVAAPRISRGSHKHESNKLKSVVPSAPSAKLTPKRIGSKLVKRRITR